MAEGHMSILVSEQCCQRGHAGYAILTKMQTASSEAEDAPSRLLLSVRF